MSLADVKTLLDIQDDGRDAQLNLIISMVETQLKSKLNDADTIPSELAYVVTEVTVSRFNRLGSEGMSEHMEETLRVRFNGDDFAPYEWHIQKVLGEGGSQARPGRVMFL